MRRAAILFAAALAVALPAAAQEARVQVPSPILTIDSERLFSGSRFGSRVAEELEAERAALAAENRQIEAELSAEELDLTERRATLDPDEFRALADAFDEKVQRIRAEQDAKTADLQRLREVERQRFLETIAPILSALVRERGAVAIIERRTVFLAAESIDITDEAIARINASLGEGLSLPVGEGEGRRPETEDPSPSPEPGETSEPADPAVPVEE